MMNIKYITAFLLIFKSVSSVLASDAEAPFDDLLPSWREGAVYYDPAFSQYAGQALYFKESGVPAARIDRDGYTHLNANVFGMCTDWEKEQARLGAAHNFLEEHENVLSLIDKLTVTSGGSVRREYVHYGVIEGLDFANVWLGYVLFASYGRDTLLREIFATIKQERRSQVFKRVRFAVTPAMPRFALLEGLPSFQQAQASHENFSSLKKELLGVPVTSSSNLKVFLENFIDETKA